MARGRRTWTRRALFDPRYVRTESRRAYRLACLLFMGILLAGVCERYVVGVGIITDRSMLPSLSEDQYFMVNKYIYHLTRPRRGDIVVIRKQLDESEEYFVKRVIALENEVLFIRSGRVYVNGRLLEEPYVQGQTYPSTGPVVLGPGAYFVMGDNRWDSQDSREFGSVSLSEIRGRLTPGRLFAAW